MFDVTAGPDGGVPLAVAVFATAPEFTSACEMVRVAVHVVDAPGGSVVTGHDTADIPGNGSDTATDVNVTLPVLVTRNEYVCTSPNDAPAGTVSVVRAADFVSVIVFVCSIGVDVDEEADVIAGPVGGVPLAVAVLAITPVFTSACVIVRVAVHVVDAPGANVVDGQLMADRPVSGSAMLSEARVTLPVLVTRNENVCTSPNDAPVGAVSVVMATVLVSVTVVVWLIGVVVDELFDVTAGPVGGVPEPDAVLMIDPAFTSDWVMVRVAVQVVEAPGANVVDGHEMTDRPPSGSVTLTEVKVTLPVLVTRNENVCTSPNDAPVGAVSVVMATVLANDRVLV